MNDRRVIYRGRKIDLALQRITLADGTSGEREVVVHRGAVALLVEVDDEHICLVRNRRYAVGKTLLEVPAGTLEPGESPAKTAAREVTEETGYRAGRIVRISEWWVSPGVMTERMYLYQCSDLSPGPTALQPDEDLEPLVVSWKQALSLVDSGEIDDAKTLLALSIGAARRLAQRPS